MNNTEIPKNYIDLPQDELKLLLYYNQIKLQSAESENSRNYYQQKINYISSLIKE